MKTIKIPKPIRHELAARLEEQGSYDPADDFAPLLIKINKAYKDGIVELNDKEVSELAWHCQTMDEIAEDHYRQDKQFNKEARWARHLRKQLLN